MNCACHPSTMQRGSSRCRVTEWSEEWLHSSHRNRRGLTGLSLIIFNAGLSRLSRLPDLVEGGAILNHHLAELEMQHASRRKVIAVKRS